ncbi:MAG: hypothetical protein VX185_12285 [Pseudomonadota bacterium]|nr:hypothetical protein [Pseudomonadota bacterium]
MYSITNTSSAAQNSSLEPRREILLNTLISKIGQKNSGSPSADVKHIAGFCWKNMISPNPNHPNKIGDIVADPRVSAALTSKGFKSLGLLIDLRDSDNEDIKNQYLDDFKMTLPQASEQTMKNLFKKSTTAHLQG